MGLTTDQDKCPKCGHDENCSLQMLCSICGEIL